jgi:hypothetical protein
MQFTSRTIRYALVASLGVLAACDNSELPTAPLARAESLVPSLAVELSSSTARSGDRVAIAIANLSASPIGAVQGRLRFNPSQLSYRGQVRDASSDAIMVVNADDASAGVLRVAVLDPANLKRSAALVFNVIGQDYAGSISFVPEEVATNGAQVKTISARVANNVVINNSLLAPADAAPMSIDDWYQAVSANQISAEPGMVINGLKYGDIDGNTLIQLTDALYVVNVSVGAAEMITGTDTTVSGSAVRRDPVVAGNVVPANLNSGYAGADIGEAGDPLAPGVESNGSRLLTLADALAIVNESVGADQPVVGAIIPGRPTTPASTRVTVSANITTNTTWSNNNIYELTTKVTVTNGATLTIEPGTQVEGATGTVPGGSDYGYLVIARDGKINAQGTPLQPIIFTCALGTATARAKGCWGGISVLGNAHVNETGTLTSPIIAGRATTGGCREASAEGAAGLYGGCNEDDNSGVISYARIEYAGFRYDATNELNSLALYAVGRGTTISHIDNHAGKDDGIEMFGGTVNVKYIYMVATEDDAFDYTFGWDGKAQFVIAQHNTIDSDNGMEADNASSNFDALPRSMPTLYNFTFVGPRNNRVGTSENRNRGLLIRRGARPTIRNFHVEGYSEAVSFVDAPTCVDFQVAGNFTLQNSTFALNGSDGSATTACGAATTIITSNNNQKLTDSPLLEPRSFKTPDFRPSASAVVTGATPPNDGFFDVSATYVGAVAPATSNKNNAPWYAGWVRGWQSITVP